MKNRGVDCNLDVYTSVKNQYSSLDLCLMI